MPHSDIHGSKPARSSPWLFAACHVLHRLLVPRHPPNALIALNPCTLVRGCSHHAQEPSCPHRQRPHQPPGLTPDKPTPPPAARHNPEPAARQASLSTSLANAPEPYRHHPWDDPRALAQDPFRSDSHRRPRQTHPAHTRLGHARARQNHRVVLRAQERTRTIFTTPKNHADPAATPPPQRSAASQPNLNQPMNGRQLPVVSCQTRLAQQAWRLSDSNRSPPACKAGALPDELSPLQKPVFSRQSSVASLQIIWRLPPGI